MKTPIDSWNEYRNFVYASELEEGDEQERQRAFFAGSEAVFRLMESCDGFSVLDAMRSMREYREANKAAAMETMSPEDRLIAEVERKSALGEIQ